MDNYNGHMLKAPTDQYEALNKGHKDGGRGNKVKRVECDTVYLTSVMYLLRSGPLSKNNFQCVPYLASLSFTDTHLKLSHGL